MAKSQTARSTIKNDPFATLIPDREAEQAAREEEANEAAQSGNVANVVVANSDAPSHVAPSGASTHSVAASNVVTPLRREQPQPVQATSKADGQKKEKLTVHLTHDLIERVKNAAYWNPRLTIASIAEIGVKFAIEQVERENGGAYPPRESELKGGRPIGS